MNQIKIQYQSKENNTLITSSVRQIRFITNKHPFLKKLIWLLYFYNFHRPDNPKNLTKVINTTQKLIENSKKIQDNLLEHKLDTINVAILVGHKPRIEIHFTKRNPSFYTHDKDLFSTLDRVYSNIPSLWNYPSLKELTGLLNVSFKIATEDIPLIDILDFCQEHEISLNNYCYYKKIVSAIDNYNQLKYPTRFIKEYSKTELFKHTGELKFISVRKTTIILGGKLSEIDLLYVQREYIVEFLLSAAYILDETHYPTITTEGFYYHEYQQL